MKAQIRQALEQGACLVTATNRLGYELRAAYDAEQLAEGKTVWPSANVLSWDAWMQTLWDHYSAHTVEQCLNRAQLQHLLLDIIRADLSQALKGTGQTTALWNLAATAKIAADAWQICHQWHISFTALKDAEQIDHQQFGRWAKTLYQRLQREHWITEAQIPDRLIKSNHPLNKPSFLYGFDQLNSQQVTFLKHYAASGATIEQIPSNHKTLRTIPHYEFEDNRAQWQQIGAWAKQKLSAAPHSKIAIITPNIEDQRNIASRCLREQLCPDYYQQAGPEPFHFSQGGALSETPLVSGALKCLDLLGTIDFEDLAPIFLSCFWGKPVEQQFRAECLLQLGQKLAYRFDLFELIRALSFINNNDTASALLNKLNRLQAIKAAHRGKLSLSAWRDVIKQCLVNLGWPGSPLYSNEYQAQQAWQQALENWIKLDAVVQPMSLDQACNSLKAHCQQTPFQAQAQADAPIQIMGVLEAAELDFDAVWLAGFDEQAWPVRAGANPFIPIKLQIKASIPEASQAQLAELTRLKTEQLCTLCDEVIVSHAQVHGDLTLGLSPVFSAIESTPLSVLPEPFDLYQAIRAATPDLQSESDNIGLVLNDTQARGGVGLIESQSACPFQAYARYRLQAGEGIEPQIGMNALEHGSLLHETLATIWQALGSSEALIKLIELGDGFMAFIAGHVEPLVERYARRSGLKSGFIKAESSRLNNLIAEWLMLESTRQPFSVAAIEQRVEHTINGLSFTFGIDRIDKANNDSQLIIDYKSGSGGCDEKKWAGDRPDSPQLPLYFLSAQHAANHPQIDALAFAQVVPNQCQFVGASRLDDALPGVAGFDSLKSNTTLKKDFSEWSNLAPMWSKRLEILVKEYQDGVAHVDPKQSPQTCQYCEFDALCRVQTRKDKHDAE